MRLRNSNSARLTHVATVGDVVSTDRSYRRRIFAIVAMTGVMLGVFLAARHWSASILAAHWTKSLETVPDDRAETLVASAAGLGRPGIPVLVTALGSPRESVASAGQLWLDRQLRSWENRSDHEAQRNVEALAIALAAEHERFDPAARLEAARLAARILRWRLDGNVVDRQRVTWLCDRVLQAADFTIAAPGASPPDSVTEKPEIQQDNRANEVLVSDEPPEMLPLDYPRSPQEEPVRERFALQPVRAVTPNIIPLPNIDRRSGSNDLAESWAMRGRHLDGGTKVKVYPSTGDRVLVPSSPDVGETEQGESAPNADLSLAECVQRLHAAGIEALAAEEELRRRGFDDLQLSIARRVSDPDRNVRLQLVRDLPGMSGVGASDWLIMLTGDTDEEIRLTAITLLGTAGDPRVLAQVESIARNDPAERIRRQADRLAKRRQVLIR